MNKKNEKGFALVLSIILLLVMSLMGGSLIVISAGDHQSNNTSDEYQQTFYVAETALLEGRKRIQNKMMGPWIVVDDEYAVPPEGMSDSETTEWNNMVNDMKAQAATQGGFARDTDKRDLPTNRIAIKGQTPCFQSFRNINRTGFLVTDHEYNKNFGTMIRSIFNDADLDPRVDADTLQREEERMQRFRYEYFIVNIGSAAFRGYGGSVKKTTTSAATSGTLYKIYGCGYMMPKGTTTEALDIAAFLDLDPDILIPLESTVIYQN